MANTGKRYTPAERSRILAAARRDGLTGKQTSEKFGVSEVTLWKWRKASKPARVGRTNRTSDGSLDRLLRSQVRDRIQQLLPDLIRNEVARYVQQVLDVR